MKTIGLTTIGLEISEGWATEPKASVCSANLWFSKFLCLKGAWVQCFFRSKKLPGRLTGSLTGRGYTSRTSGHESLVPLNLRVNVGNDHISGHVRPRQGTEICNFGAPSPLEALHWIFSFFSRFSVQFSKTRPPKSGESSEKSSGENRVKSCHVCGCHGFFGAEHHNHVM